MAASGDGFVIGAVEETGEPSLLRRQGLEAAVE